MAQRAYDTYARLWGRGQSLERLAERGGFGIQEFACLFNGHSPKSDHVECREKVDAVNRKIAELTQKLEVVTQELSNAEVALSKALGWLDDSGKYGAILRSLDHGIEMLVKQRDEARANQSRVDLLEQAVAEAMSTLNDLLESPERLTKGRLNGAFWRFKATYEKLEALDALED